MSGNLAINGGKKICENLEQLKKCWPPKVNGEKALIEKFINERNFISNMNKNIENIAEKMKRALNSKYFSFFSSGASALHAALIACDIGPGDEVIVPSYTFAAPAFAVLRVGAIPVFADVDLESYNIDERETVKLLKKFKKIKAIIAVHMNGYPANVKKLRQIADKYKIKLIEDVAQAYGGKIDGKMVGTYGHIGCFSFMAAKQLATCGELGGICSDDVNIINKANSVKTYGQKIIEDDSNFYYNTFSYGYNYKASPLNCLFLGLQLKNFDSNISIVKKNAKKLREYVYKNIPFLIPHKVDIGFEHVYHFCRFRCETSQFGIDSGLFREALMEIMEAEGLPLRLYQTHPTYKQEIFTQVFNNKINYPWKFNSDYINMYRENYSDLNNPNTLKIIDSTFSIGGSGAAPNYLFNEEIVELYIQGFKKIKENLKEVIDYCKKKTFYVSPYLGIARLSDTKGEFK